MKNNKRIIVVLLLSIMMIPLTVLAKGSNPFQAGDNLRINSPLSATSFTAGNNVDVQTEIDGINFVAGNNITLNSSQDYLFVAGNVLNLEEVNTKDAFLAGSLIQIKDSNIRDLYAAAETIHIDSYISRNVYAGGETVTINSTIDGDVKIAAETIEIGKDAVINGTLQYPEESELKIASGAQVEKKESYKATTTIDTHVTITSIIMERITAYLTMLVTGLVLLLLCKKTLKKIEKIKAETSNILSTIGIGFLSLIATPFAAIIGLCTVVGIPLSIIALLLYGILIYLSIIPATYYVGNILLKDKIENKYLLFTVTLLIIYLLKMIPVLGGLVSFLVLCFGLGIDARLIKESMPSTK